MADDTVTVTQADRDAAADYLGARDIRAGMADSHTLVEAFARHRIANRPAPDAGARETLNRHLTGAEDAHYEGDGGSVVFHLRKARELLA